MNVLRQLVVPLRLMKLPAIERSFHSTSALCSFAIQSNLSNKNVIGVASANRNRRKLTDIEGIAVCTIIRTFRTTSSVLYPEEKHDVSGEKVLNVKLPSRRIDAVLKVGLAMSRNKIEKAFYEDRIRLNGTRPTKKSQEVEDGDEIDVVRGYNKLNPDRFLDVNRIEIARIGADQDDDDSDSESDSLKIPAILKRSKQLTIENYSPPWKGTTADI